MTERKVDATMIVLVQMKGTNVMEEIQVLLQYVLKSITRST